METELEPLLKDMCDFFIDKLYKHIGFNQMNNSFKIKIENLEVYKKYFDFGSDVLKTTEKFTSNETVLKIFKNVYDKNYRFFNLIVNYDNNRFNNNVYVKIDDTYITFYDISSRNNTINSDYYAFLFQAELAHYYVKYLKLNESKIGTHNGGSFTKRLYNILVDNNLMYLTLYKSVNICEYIMTDDFYNYTMINYIKTV